MRTQIYDINLVVGAGIPPIVKVSQNDELRVLAFRLFDGIREYFPFENEEVTITGTKPSGLGFTEECSVNGSLATVETTLAMTQESGRINAELRISDGSTNIGTANFTLYVEPAPHPAGTIDGTTEEARTVLEQCEYYAGLAQDAAEAASGDYTQLAAEIGTLSELTTTAKSSAVAAINEVKDDLDSLDERVEALESGSGGSGLTDDIKTALMNLVNHVTWDDDDPTGQTYITALQNALYPPVDLVSISAVYTQSDTVYDTNTLNDLKSDLVVTAHYSDNTTGIITDYTLSGTLTEGTSTITVTYGGKTTTFTVTVTANPYLAYWDFTQSLADVVNGYEFTLSCGSRGTLERTSEGLVFSCPDTGSYDANAQLPNTVTFPKGSKLTVEFGASDAQMTSNSGDKGSTYGFGNGSLMGGVASIYWRGSSEKFYSYGSSWSDRWISTAPDYFNNKTLVVEVASDRTRTLTVDGVAFGTVPGSAISSDTYTFFFGRKASDGQTFHNIVIKKVYVETLSS